MSPSSLKLLPLAALLAACGPESSGPTGRFGLDVVMSSAVANEVHALQVSVLTRGSSRSCTELQTTCLNSQVRREDLVVLEDARGNEGRALRFTVDLAAMQSGGSQSLDVDVPVGRDYALVIEAMAVGSPSRFLGSSCNYLKVVNSGTNAPLVAAPLVLTEQSCDPSIAP
ncbi:hypothetical protein LY474_34425 [Myxococcus stipitatus]|uniref:hypothetical protein n=1 Tax=Myxococcus stipitatus TaxID=83455 RepID=UPI001F20EAE0|nr:hypothetical protein [Myxococcus stipitatus]MCE9672915.1 hypothetical protein [Myxococcus stipitatus]